MWRGFQLQVRQRIYRLTFVYLYCMSKMTSYIIRTQAFVLALLVFMLSSGFTYHWQGCLYADTEPICAVVDQMCCCSETPQTSVCICAGAGDKSCELSFSKYIQFNFETQLSDPLELQPKLAEEPQSPLYFCDRESLLQKTNIFHSSPPPKSGREILHLYSVLVV